MLFPLTSTALLKPSVIPALCSSLVMRLVVKRCNRKRLRRYNSGSFIGAPIKLCIHSPFPRALSASNSTSPLSQFPQKRNPLSAEPFFFFLLLLCFLLPHLFAQSRPLPLTTRAKWSRDQPPSSSPPPHPIWRRSTLAVVHSSTLRPRRRRAANGPLSRARER